MNEKGSININYTNDISGQHPGGNSTVALPVHAYVHDTMPQTKAFANPGPLCGSTLAYLSVSSLLTR